MLSIFNFIILFISIFKLTLIVQKYTKDIKF